MTVFLIYAATLTFIYVLYYAVMITLDLRKARLGGKTKADVIAVEGAPADSGKSDDGDEEDDEDEDYEEVRAVSESEDGFVIADVSRQSAGGQEGSEKPAAESAAQPLAEAPAPASWLPGLGSEGEEKGDTQEEAVSQGNAGQQESAASAPASPAAYPLSEGEKAYAAVQEREEPEGEIVEEEFPDEGFTQDNAPASYKEEVREETAEEEDTPAASDIEEDDDDEMPGSPFAARHIPTVKEEIDEYMENMESCPPHLRPLLSAGEMIAELHRKDSDVEKEVTDD